MVDICLELPSDIIAAYRLRAVALGCDAEELMRGAIETYAAGLERPTTAVTAKLGDEAVVKAAEIEKEYRRLGYRYGWRFITCPHRQTVSAKLLLVSLNPAGRAEHGPAWSQELGSAYRVEPWGGLAAGTAPLQRQIQYLFQLLGLDDAEVFSAHYVPFRSPSWNDLDQRDQAEAFSKKLWRWLLPTVTFERIVCIGKEKPGRPIADMMGASLEASLPVGWGQITADRYRLPDGRPLIALPHLSRFGIFGRLASAAPLRALFEL